MCKIKLGHHQTKKENTSAGKKLNKTFNSPETGMTDLVKSVGSIRHDACTLGFRNVLKLEFTVTFVHLTDRHNLC